MNWQLHEDGIVRNQSAWFAATAAEKEFWARIQELEDSLKFWKNETKNQDAAIFFADKRIQELELAIKDRDERIAAATRVIGSSLEKLKEH